MAMTISELEAERAKILEEIESKAGNLSGTSQQDANPSLNDWLNAAEQVMPEKKTRQTAQATQSASSNDSYSNKLLKTSHSNGTRQPFFGIVILLTLLLTIIGIIYIAYTTINKELDTVVTYKEQSTQQINAMQDSVKSLQESVATGGKPEVFTQLENKVASLEAEVKALKAQVADLTSKLDGAKSGQLEVSANDVSTEAPQPVANLPVENDSSLVVTEAVLDQKLKLYTEQLESKIDGKLEKIINYLTAGEAPQGLTADNPVDNNLKATAIKPKADEEVDAPTVETVETPVVETPIIKMVEKVESPATPEVPTAPVINMTSDVKWLMEQPKPHYILQLASMPNQDSLNKIVRNKQLKETKIVPQTRKGVTNYVLLTGSYANKKDAQKLANQIKSESGVTPWIRQVQDLTRRIN